MPRDTGAPAIGLLAEVDDLGGGVVVRVTRTEPMKAASAIDPIDERVSARH